MVGTQLFARLFVSWFSWLVLVVSVSIYHRDEMNMCLVDCILCTQIKYMFKTFFLQIVVQCIIMMPLSAEDPNFSTT